MSFGGNKMDYENLTWEGTINRKIYTEERDSSEGIYSIISPQGRITATRLEISLANGGAYCPEFLEAVPDSAIGKRAIMRESLKTERNIKTHTQELMIEGLEPIVASLKYEVN